MVGYFGKDDCLIYTVDDGAFVVLLLSSSILTLSAVDSVSVYHGPARSLFHSFSALDSGDFSQDLRGFAVGHNPEYLAPYLFTFGSTDGSVKIWSSQSNHVLDECESARLFELRDYRGWYLELVTTIGR